MDEGAVSGPPPALIGDEQKNFGVRGGGNMKRRPGSMSQLSGAVNAAIVFSTFACTPLAIADNGRDFAGTYRIEGPVDSRAPTVPISLVVRLQNVSGAVVTNSVVEIDSQPPAPLAQSFPSAISVPDRGFVTIRGTFTVSSSDARRWQNGISPAPSLVVIGPDAKGKIGRRKVELLNLPGAMQ